MKIIDNTVDIEVQLAELDDGHVFSWDGSYYLATDFYPCEGSRLVVELEEGQTMDIQADQLVLPVIAVLTVGVNENASHLTAPVRR